ncbi:MAG: hypothetical protein M3N08_08075 [Pseudomonadota bacterium]|nr:hypothetical protein [Pseudomonadota bacterium]
MRQSVTSPSISAIALPRSPLSRGVSRAKAYYAALDTRPAVPARYATPLDYKMEVKIPKPLFVDATAERMQKNLKLRPSIPVRTSMGARKIPSFFGRMSETMLSAFEPKPSIPAFYFSAEDMRRFRLQYNMGHYNLG